MRINEALMQQAMQEIADRYAIYAHTAQRCESGGHPSLDTQGRAAGLLTALMMLSARTGIDVPQGSYVPPVSDYVWLGDICSEYKKDPTHPRYEHVKQEAS